jgi:diacylglycerol kinase
MEGRARDEKVFSNVSFSMKEVVSRSHYQLQGIHYALKSQSLLYHTSLHSLELIVVCGNLAMDGSKSIVMVQLLSIVVVRLVMELLATQMGV